MNIAATVLVAAGSHAKILGNTTPRENSFGNMLEEAITSIKEGEKSANAIASGKGDVFATVEAVLSAERNLQMVIAVRDRAVGAIQEISRMSL